MAKLYGSIVGQPTQAFLASGVGLVSACFKGGSDLVLWRDYVTTSGNVIGDQVSMGSFKSTTVFDPWNSFFMFASLGAGLTLNIGDVNYPAGIRNGYSVSGNSNELVFGGPGVGAPVVAVSAFRRLWQRLGYASDPGGVIELLATFGGVNPANGGGFGWTLLGQQQ